MRRPDPRLAVLALTLLLPPAAGQAQALRIRDLHLSADAAPGPWASFLVRTQSRNLPPREFVQRVAIVASEGIGPEAGVWVELKSIDPRAGTRIERGFFTRPSEGGLSGRAADEPPPLRLERLQRWTSDGHLYEYPPDSEMELRADEEVALVGLFEVSYLRAPTVDTLGVDTLRLGRKELESQVVRRQFVGADEWPDDRDNTRVRRAILTTVTARCDEVPVTGYTRSLMEARAGSFAVTDTLALEPLPPPEGETDDVFYRVELTLTDMGDGAVPEVTQEPEPAPLPEEETPRPGPVR